MNQDTIISSRPDREIRKKIITPGDYTTVPYEDARCRITISDVKYNSDTGKCGIEAESRLLSQDFDGNVLIGDLDCFIDKDIELILQQMCCGEVAIASLVYRDAENRVAEDISLKIELREVMEEQLISDWGWERLYEAALHHKERGVELVTAKRITDGFRRFNKALKMLVAIEPVDPQAISKETVAEMVDLKVKLLNNLAHCQLHYKAFEATLELCTRALKYDTENVKALYRRSSAYSGLHLHEDAWRDIQEALRISPNDKALQDKAELLKPKIERINKEYSSVIKKMFG